MRNILTDYFYYSRGERNGLIILIIISSLFLLIAHLSTRFSKPPKAIEFEEYDKTFLAFQNSSNTATAPKGFYEAEASAESLNKATLFTFDPNKASYEDFVLLGLPVKTASTIIHYREKGGRFYKREDLQKIYGLKFEDYKRLEGFIEIEDKSKSFGNHFEKGFSKPFDEQNKIPKELKVFAFDPNKATEIELLTLGLEKKVVKNLLKFREKNGHFYKKEDLKKIYGFAEIDYIRLENFIQISDNHSFTQIVKDDMMKIGIDRKNTEIKEQNIDVNKASFEEWLQLRGIGRTFATRIIEQREKLGGFASLEQVKETYGIPDSTYRAIVPYLKISTAIFRKISINKTDIPNLNHPYLTRRQAEILVRYKVNHGDFKNLSDVRKTGVFTDALLEKLNPYLDFN
jgi:competence protein ComEA